MVTRAKPVRLGWRPGALGCAGRGALVSAPQAPWEC